MKRIIWLVLVLLFAVAPALAQETTEVRFYLIPMIRVNQNGIDYRLVKYFPQNRVTNPTALPALAGVQYAPKDYGLIDQAVVAANLTAAQEAALAAQTDIYIWPANLDVNATQADLQALSAYLDAAAVPSNWITGSETYRSALRTITGFFLFMQRFTTITGENPLLAGINLNTQFQNLSAAYQNAILQAFSDLGYDSSVITANMTIRQILKNASDQWGTQPIYFGFVTL